MVKDFKNRFYYIISISNGFTYLECVTTNASLKIANAHFSACGFEGV